MPKDLLADLPGPDSPRDLLGDLPPAPQQQRPRDLLADPLDEAATRQTRAPDIDPSIPFYGEPVLPAAGDTSPAPAFAELPQALGLPPDDGSIDAEPGPTGPMDQWVYGLNTGMNTLGGALARAPETAQRIFEYESTVGVPGVPRTAAGGLAQILEPVTEGVDVGPVSFPGTQDLAGYFDQNIEDVNRRTPRAAERTQAINQEANDAFAAAAQGDFAPLGQVLTSPDHMGQYTMQALPSFAAAYASGGSLPFIAMLETAEVTKNAEDFERRTGVAVPPEEYARAVAIVATINTALERTGLDSVVRRAPGKTLASKFFRTLFGGGVEAGTEGAQEITTNVASRLFDPEIDPYEGAGAAALGGGGMGLSVSAAQQVQPAQPQQPPPGPGQAPDHPGGPVRTPDLLDEAEAAQAQPQPAPEQAPIVDPLVEAIQAAAVQPQQAQPVQPEPAQPVQPPQAAPVAPETAAAPPASQAPAQPQQAAPVAPEPTQPADKGIRRGRDEEYGVDVELRPKEGGGYLLVENDPSGAIQGNERAIEYGAGGVYFGDGILNEDGEFVDPRTINQNSAEKDPAKRPFKGSREEKQRAVDLAAQMAFARAIGDHEQAAALESQLVDLAMGAPSRPQSLPQEPPVAQPVPAPAPSGPSVPGDAVTVFTPDNQPVEARYEAVEAEDLIASHTPEGRPNPAFPADRQPRQRERAASQTQIQSIARSLNPALLEQSPTTDTGAPIVDAGNVVESGNGRVAAIQLAAREGNAQVLKDYLQQNAERFGIDPQAVAGMRNPVLVRRRTTELDERGQQEFARASNVSGMARFSPAEQAELDAERLTEDDLALFEPGEDGNVLARSNETFVKRFMERAGSADAAAMRDPQGRPNREAVARIQAAMFQKAYGDRDLVQLAAEDADPDVRNILNGLQRAAPAFARARGIDAEQTGEISDGVVRAIQLFRGAKQARQDVDEHLAQQGLFEAESAEAAKIASFIAANTRSAKTLGDAFEEMATLLESELVRAQNLSMFDGLDVQPQEIISRGIETAEQRRAERSPASRQQGIFEAQEPGPQPAPAGRREGEPGQDQRRAGPGVSGEVSELGPAPFEVSYDGQASQVRESDAPAGPGGSPRARSGAVPAGQGQGGTQLDIFAAPQREAGQARQETARAPKPLVTNARVGQFSVAGGRINGPEDAAHVFAPLRKSAQEQLLAMVTDDAGRPLEIHRHTIGGIASASSYPGLLVAQALSVPGATRIWFAHNHPGGNPQQSTADRRLTDKLESLTAEVGLRSEGMIVVAPGKGWFTHYAPSTASRHYSHGDIKQDIPPRVRRARIPVTERRFRSVSRTEDTQQNTLDSPRAAQDYLELNDLAGTEGVLMLNQRHNPVGFLELSAEQMARVGSERGAARQLAAALERANAAAFIPNLRADTEVARRAMQGIADSEFIKTGWRMLDVMNNGDSMAQAGILEQPTQYDAGEQVREDEGGRASDEPGRVTPQRPGGNERGFITRHPLNDIEQAQKKRYARIERAMVAKLSKIGMARDVPDAYRIMVRRFRAAVQKGAHEAEAIIKQRDQLSAEHRRLISDYLEGELQQGVVPPENVKAYAAMMQEAIASQTEELIRLGMLSRETANRWRGRYLTRYYLKTDKPIPKALRRQFNKVDGHFLKGRGMFEMVQKRDIENWKKLGWEIRDPQSDTQEVINNLRDNDKVLMWRDYTPAERERMGEIRDAVYRFARGHMETARDIAIGRLFKAIAESDFASPRQTHEDQVQVPDTKILGTGGVKRYGALAGMWVHKDIWNDLEAIKDPDLGGGEVWRQYMRGLSFWKEGKALALDTPLPTPDGWTTMGEVQPGDQLLDEAGTPCTVTYATEVQLDRTCYRVRFSDSTSVVADAEHQWFTVHNGDAAVRTTAQIVSTFKDGGEKHSIPQRPPFNTRQITDIEPAESVPARCIQVDSPSRLYLAGEGMVPTHNTALNPVVHSNNVWSSWIMADLYGISPWDVKAYREALKDYTGKGPFYQEAIDNGLFGTEFYGTEIRQVASELTNFESMEKAAAGKLRRMIDYGARFSGARAYRRGMGRLYRAEDQFFKLLIYKDMREKGATVDEAIDEAERWIFNYMDLPKGARMIKNSPVGLPFFSYTYKAVPALTYAAVTAPWRYAKWIALFGGFNYLAFAALFGPDHEEREEEERKVMPDYMKGLTPFLVQKHIRWPFDRRPGVATYLGLERRFPMGDLFDINNQLGGVGILQPLMPNNPVFTTATALVFGKDSFTGRDIANDAESAESKISKYMGWLYYQYMPNTPMLPFSYSFDKVMNGVAHEMGEPVEVIPTVKEYTGKNFHGEEQTLARAFGSTVFGFKIREFDVDRQTARMNRELQGKIRDLKFQIRGTARDQSLTEAIRQRQIRDLREQIDALVREHREERN